jgi:hypothetical protein
VVADFCDRTLNSSRNAHRGPDRLWAQVQCDAVSMLTVTHAHTLAPTRTGCTPLWRFGRRIQGIAFYAEN